MNRIILLILILWNQQSFIFAQNSIDSAMNHGIHFLKNTQTSDGSFQDSLNPLFSVWETILVCHSLKNILPAKDTSLQKAINWLKENKNSDGYICHNLKCKETYCIETSMLYFHLALNEWKEAQSTFLVSKQKTDGSWNVGNPDVTEALNFPSVTGFVLNFSDFLGITLPNEKQSLEFLVNQQLANGTWGEHWEYYGTPAYAVWQIYPVFCRRQSYQTVQEKTKDWILSSQLANGNWHFTAGKSGNQVSSVLETALLLDALMQVSDSDLKVQNAIQKGVAYLLKEQQTNGSWYGGRFPVPNPRYKKEEYLFATSLVLDILRKYRQK